MGLVGTEAIAVHIGWMSCHSFIQLLGYIFTYNIINSPLLSRISKSAPANLKAPP